MFFCDIIIIGGSMKNSGNRYDIEAIIIVTILGITGFGMIIGSYLMRENLYDMIYYDGVIIIFGGFFIGVALYCHYLYLFNVILKPKEATLFLKSSDDELYEFVDSKGKLYYFEKENEYKENQFYDVCKTKDNIKKIIGVSSKTFTITKTKKSYWLNFYSPFGSFENLFLLPIVYVMALPGILSFILANGFGKIFGLLFSGYPIYLIIYDFNKKRNRF